MGGEGGSLVAVVMVLIMGMISSRGHAVSESGETDATQEQSMI